MGTTALLDDLEVDTGEDAVTADIPVDDPAAIPADLGDEAPEGEEHPLADGFDPLLGFDPVEAIVITEVSGMTPLGLNAGERIRARDLAVQAAALAVQKNASIEYTMGPKRWDPIKRKRKAFRGEAGNFQDCSSFATWCLWNGLSHFGVRDVVNGQRFRAGWTGSMINHGQRVSRAEVLRGDCVFYAGSDGRIGHVTIYVGGGMVISHGSEPGPRKLRIDYRPIAQIRRYIRA